MGRKRKSSIDRILELAEKGAVNTIGPLVPVNLKVTDISSLADLKRVGQSPFLAVIDQLLNHHLYEKPTSPVILESQMALRLVVCEFMNCRFGLNPPILLVDEIGKEIRGARKTLIKIQARTIAALFSVANEVFPTIGVPGYRNSIELWGHCVIEDFVLTEEFLHSSEYTQATKRKAIAAFKSCTQSLREMKNPYEPSAHRDIFEAAIRLAGRSTARKADKYSFYAQQYLPYLSARSDFSGYISKKESKTRLMGK